MGVNDLIGRRIILEDGSPHSGEVVVITDIDGPNAVAEPIDPHAFFAKVLIPLTDLDDDTILDEQEFSY